MGKSGNPTFADLSEEERNSIAIWPTRLRPGKQKCEMFHVESCTCICVSMFMYVQREYNETTQTSCETSEGTPKSGRN
jgi:hypothetical protein